MDTTSIIGAGSRDEEAVNTRVEPCPFRPMGDAIVVELIEREEVTDSGILIVEEKKERPTDAVVVGISRSAAEHFDRNEDEVVERGTVLMIRKGEMLRVAMPDDGRELYIVRPTAVYGIA